MISIVIPAYNTEHTLKACLDSLEKQTVARDGYEIIVVDDGSTDHTAKLVKKYSGVVYVHQKQSGESAARNTGVEKADGDIVVFVDADCEAKKNFLEEIIKPLNDDAVWAVKGAYVTKQKGIVARLVQVEFEERYSKMQKSKKLDFVDNSASAYRKKLFYKAGMFDTKLLMSMDTDLAYRIERQGYKIAFNPDAQVYHAHPTTLKVYWEKKFWRSYWRMDVYKNFPKKILQDSYTPQTLKLQIVSLFLLILLTALLPMVPEAKYFIYAVLLCVIGLFVPLTFRAFRSGIIEGLLMPFFIIGRALSLGFGVLYYFFEIKNFRELIAFITIALIIIVPSFFTGGLDLIARTIVFILVFPALFFAIRSDKPTVKGRIPFKYNIFIPLALFFLIAAVLVFFSVSPYDSYSTLIHWISYAMLFLSVYYLISSRAEAFKFAYVIVFLAVVLSVIGTYFFVITEHYNYLRFISTFYQHNPFAGFLLFALPLSYAFLLYADNARKRWIFLVITAFLTLAFVLTHSRGAWISFVVPFLLLLFYTMRDRKNISRILGIVALLIVITSAGWWGLNEVKHYQAERLSAATDTEVTVRYSIETAEENAYIARLHFWDGAQKIFTDHPVAGTGLDTYKIVYRQYLEDIRYYTIDPHNLYLKMFAELGVVGGSVFIWFIGIVFFVIVAGVRTIKSIEKKSDKALMLGLAGGLLGSLAHNFVELDWQFPTNMIVFFVILGVYYKLFIINHEKHGSRINGNGDSLVNHRIFQGGAILLAFVVLIGGSLQFLSTTFTQNAESKKDNLLLEESELILKDAVLIDPLNSALRLKFADVYFLLIPDDIDYYKEKYVSSLEKTISLSPHHYLAYTILGRHYSFLNEYTKAEEYLTQSIVLNPIGDPSVYIFLAKLYNEQEKYSEAREILERAIGLYDPKIKNSIIWVAKNRSKILDDIASIHNSLGLEYMRTEDFGEAKRQFILGLEYNTKHQGLIKNLAEVSLRMMENKDDTGQ